MFNMSEMSKKEIQRRSKMNCSKMLCFVAEQLMTGNERERNGVPPGERQNRMLSLGPNILTNVFTRPKHFQKCYHSDQTFSNMLSLGPNIF